MKKIAMSTIERQYNNFGLHAEQTLAYTLTGEIRSHGKLSYMDGSDIPEFHMSVKSSGFSLMSGNLCQNQDFDGIVEEFFSNTASSSFAYVTQSMECFVMNAEEFRCFVCQFCGLSKESKKNGGRCKVRMKSETKAVLEWLSTNA